MEGLCVYGVSYFNLWGTCHCGQVEWCSQDVPGLKVCLLAYTSIYTSHICWRMGATCLSSCHFIHIRKHNFLGINSTQWYLCPLSDKNCIRSWYNYPIHHLNNSIAGRILLYKLFNLSPDTRRSCIYHLSHFLCLYRCFYYIMLHPTLTQHIQCNSDTWMVLDILHVTPTQWQRYHMMFITIQHQT